MKAFESEESRRLPWHSNDWKDANTFHADIESETVHARDRFKFPGAHLDNEINAPEYWLSVIAEEAGKLSQAVNKLHISKDTGIRKQWEVEGYHRIITTSSLLRRMAEHWNEITGGTP